MKSTYRLLSIYLDRTPLPLNPPIIVDLSKMDLLQDMSEEYNLFDLECYQRRVGGGELLSYEEFNAITDIIDRQSWCERICIVLDYTSIAPVAAALYVRRILQLIRMLQERYPQIGFVLGADPEWIDEYRWIVHQIYAEEMQSVNL